MIAAEAVEKKLREARKQGTISGEDESSVLSAAIAAGVITAAKGEAVTAADAARREVIRVDDFPPDYGQI